MIATSDHDVTVSEMIEAHSRSMRAQGLSHETISARVRLLRQLHQDLPFGLAYASTDELDDWLASDSTWQPWTLYTYAMHVRGFYRWAAGRWLAIDPSIGMVRPRKPDCIPNPVTTDELEYALAHSADPWFTAIMLAAYAGLRASEIAAAHREDVTKTRIRIRRAKGGDGASVDTHPLVWKLVQSRPPGPLVRRPNGRPVTGNWLSTEGRGHFDALDMPAVHLHRFRHWFGTTLLDEGADIRVVQEALRHKSIVSTQGYTRVAGGKRRLAIRSLPAPTQRPDDHSGNHD